MAYFASPFYQGLVSLDHSCRPKPMESTYTASYRSMIERVYFIKLEAERAKEAANAKIEQRKKAARCRVACPLFETIYQTDYTSPDFKVALNQTFLEKKEKEKADEKKLLSDNKNLDGRGDEIQETQQNQQEEQIKNENQKKDVAEKRKKSKENIPDWKINGWKEKKACWIRPLSERKEYQPERILYKYTSPCKICNEEKE